MEWTVMLIKEGDASRALNGEGRFSTWSRPSYSAAIEQAIALSDLHLTDEGEPAVIEEFDRTIVIDASHWYR